MKENYKTAVAVIDFMIIRYTGCQNDNDNDMFDKLIEIKEKIEEMGPNMTFEDYAWVPHHACSFGGVYTDRYNYDPHYKALLRYIVAGNNQVKNAPGMARLEQLVNPLKPGRQPKRKQWY